MHGCDFILMEKRHIRIDPDTPVKRESGLIFIRTGSMTIKIPGSSTLTD